MERIENVNPVDLQIGDTVKGVVGIVVSQAVRRAGRVHVWMDDGGHRYAMRFFIDAKLTVTRSCP